jgi:hypothetical protein
MFEWCKGADLRALVRAKIPGATYDDWLEGWMHGIVQSRFRLRAPIDMLDIELGHAPRPYRDMFKQQKATIETIDVGQMSSREDLAKRQRRYGLVTLLSLERETCLQPLDFTNPLPFVELLLNASELLQDGGVLIWSDLYCFSRGPESIRAFLEPAALYQILEQREFVPMASHCTTVGRVGIFHDPDTLFVRHQGILEHVPRAERVTRVCCAVRRRGTCRVRYVGPRKMRMSFLTSEWRALRRLGVWRRG